MTGTPRPADRVTTLNGSNGDDGWGILHRARALAAAGHAITDLSIGDHDLPTPAPLLAAMADSAASGYTGYTEMAGDPDLRRAIADHVTHRTGVATTPANVLVTAGGQGALFAALMAVLDPGERALYLDPYYATYPGTIRAASGIPHALPLDPAQGFQPDDATLAGAPPARALLVNSPNNPTGVVYGAATRAALARFAIARDLWLISDEVYDTQVWTTEHHSLRATPGLEDRCLTIGSMSKSHRMTGARLGWLIGPKDLIAHASDLNTNTTYGVPGFIQAAATRALAPGDPLAEQVSAIYRARRTAALATLDRQSMLPVIPCEGGMYIMVDIRPTGLTSATFATRLLDERHIAVMPGSSFGAAAEGHIRIALTRPEPDLTAALGRLITFAKGLT